MLLLAEVPSSYLATTDHVTTGITAGGMAFLLALAITTLGVLGWLIIRKSQRHEDDANERAEEAAEESKRREEKVREDARLLTQAGMRMATEGNELKQVLLKLAERQEALEQQMRELLREFERVDTTLRERVKGYKGGV